MGLKNQHKQKTIYESLKSTLIGRITDDDCELIKKGLKRAAKRYKYKYNFENLGYAKIIYYHFSKDPDYIMNQQWIRIKEAIDKETPVQFGFVNSSYILHGKEHKYYKFYRYYTKYDILELVSDYYDKIPIFYHLSSGEYKINVDGLEIIPGIDSTCIK